MVLMITAILVLASCISAFSPLGVSRRRTNTNTFNFPITKYNNQNSSTQPYLTNPDENNDEYDPRDNFGRSLRSFQSSALKTVVEAGDTIVCKQSVPSLAIYENTSYEVKSIYAQSFNEETQQIIKTSLDCIDEDIASKLPTNSKLYITLFSPIHHEEPVVVSPEEVGLVTVRSELGNAALLAVPGFFWIFVASTFYNIYHERTGGSFSDAFWGR